jgi:hypothetical protein
MSIVITMTAPIYVAGCLAEVLHAARPQAFRGGLHIATEYPARRKQLF